MSTLRQDADGGNRAGRAGAAAGGAVEGGAVEGGAVAASTGPDGAALASTVSAGAGPTSAGPAGADGGAGAGGGRVTGVGVLDRSVLLLDLLAAGPRTLRWLAGASGLPRPTAYRLLVALEAHRLAARDA